MTTIEKIEHEHGYLFNIYFDEGIFYITFGGNGDLYWNFISKDNNLDEINLIITKENYLLYNLINELYERIINYDFSDIIYKNNDLHREYFKNALIYQDEFNEERLVKNGEVDYHSDDGEYDLVNVFQIKKVNDKYVITFKKVNKKINSFAVRICNNGSRYEHFNTIFMRMYKKLVEYPDLDQIHIEEYLYQNTLTRKKSQ